MRSKIGTLGVLLVVATAIPAMAQLVTLPPSGNNQKASVTQHIGLVTVTVDYSSPRVLSPSGEDRHGKIWGALVPYGLYDLGFNGRRGPWRAGANENTVFTVSHPVKVQGQFLPAGRYGLHMIAGEREFTLIFSKNASAWGSFTYDETEDALRVRSVPEKSPYREWLTYEFVERKPDRAILALEWEDLRVPIAIEVEDAAALYVDNLRKELRGAPGFSWQAWNAAAQYCLQSNRNLEEALRWAENAVSEPNVGQENFTTLSTKAQILDKLSRGQDANAAMAKALDLPAALPVEIHMYGRQLLTAGRKDEALAVFLKNQKRFGDAWPVHVGLARIYSAMGDYKTALQHAETAVRQAPDPLNKSSLEAAVARLKQGKDMNGGN
jgi:tetratricopeptide (TPR) repeat protein